MSSCVLGLIKSQILLIKLFRDALKLIEKRLDI